MARQHVSLALLLLGCMAFSAVLDVASASRAMQKKGGEYMIDVFSQHVCKVQCTHIAACAECCAAYFAPKFDLHHVIPIHAGFGPACVVSE